MIEEFGKHVRYQEGTSKEINFWLDKWVGENQLASQILLLFRCAKIVRQEYVEKIGGHLVWIPTFKRKLFRIRGGSIAFPFKSPYPS